MTQLHQDINHAIEKLSSKIQAKLENPELENGIYISTTLHEQEEGESYFDNTIIGDIYFTDEQDSFEFVLPISLCISNDTIENFLSVEQGENPFSSIAYNFAFTEIEDFEIASITQDGNKIMVLDKFTQSNVQYAEDLINDMLSSTLTIEALNKTVELDFNLIDEYKKEFHPKLKSSIEP